MCENVHVLEPSFVDEDILDWIEEECDLKDLSDELRRLLKPYFSAKEKTEQNAQNCLCRFVTTVLDYVCYVPHDKVCDIENFLKENSRVGDFERHMLKASYNIRDGRLHQAFEAYMKLLELPEAKDNDCQARIYHNLGVVLALKEDYSQAAKMFGRAYKLSGMLESMRQYLAALRMSLGEQDFLLFIGEHPELYADSVVVTEEIEKLMADYSESEEYRISHDLHTMRSRGGGAVYYDRIKQLNVEWKDAYRIAFTEG